MRPSTLAIIMMFSIALTAASAFAQSAGERADRATFNRLTQQIQRVDAEYAEAMRRAMDEARESSGSASTSTQADLLSLRDERDRLMNRLLLISVRHGWDIPDFNTPATPEAEPVVTERDRIFAPAQDAIRSRFKEEARDIASHLSLPIISLQLTEE